MSLSAWTVSRPRLDPRLALVLLAWALLIRPCAAAEPWQVRREVASFDRCEFAQPDAAEAVRRMGEVRAENGGLSGWVEFDVSVPETGWYEWLVEPDAGHNEFQVDGITLFGYGRRAEGEKDARIDSLWLDRGAHVLRIQRWIWWGQSPPSRAIVLRRTDEPAACLRIAYAHGHGDAIIRMGEDLRGTVIAGGGTRAAKLRAELRSGDEVLSSQDIDLPAGGAAQAIPFALRCPRAGAFTIEYLVDGRQLGPRERLPITAHVIDATPVARTGAELDKKLLQEIDCVAQEPDYVSGGAAAVVDGPAGKYRLSGDMGFLYAQHHATPESWFAYRLAIADVGAPHVLEVDYPDDAERTFLITVREKSTDSYPPAIGADTGGPWPLSNRMATRSLLFWPKSSEPRVALMAAHKGWPAAAARIRCYRVTGDIAPLDVPAAGGRTFFNWYEEGSNFAGFYGGAKGGIAQYRHAADLWPREVSHMGGNLIMPTVGVYQMSMYPSRFNTAFAELHQPDIVRLLLLHCEKYAVRLVAELHPETRELEYPLATREQRDNALASREGRTHHINAGPPYGHPLHPRNRAWTVGMVGELADRYADSPAFAGISLRSMGWSNPALNNFHSLDYGYDDCTIGLFEAATKLRVPGEAGDAGRFAQRYDWLMANAKERWIAWRCEAIADLYRELIARVRQARPDLKIYTTVHGMGVDAGVDVVQLGAIDGLEVIDAGHRYGRGARTYEGWSADQRRRDDLTDPDRLGASRTRAGKISLLLNCWYFEATDAVLTPTDLGLPEDTPKTWISGVVEPGGRACLERWAVALAETDAQMLGDGGNAYTLGQPLLREFNREFRHLPPVPFTPRADARDPVAVWEHAGTDGFLFYAVNREPYAIALDLTLTAKGGVKRLAGGADVALADGHLRLDLAPYQLMAFRAAAGSAIAAAAVTVPGEHRALITARVDALAKIATDADALDLDPAGRDLVRAVAEDAQRNVTQGHWWRARTMIEDHRLAEQVYNRALVFPPGLERLVDPANLPRIRLRDQPRPTATIALDCERIADGKLINAAKLSATIEGQVAIGDGYRGKGLRFAGVDGRVTLAGEALDRLSGKDCTVTVWARPTRVDHRRGLFAHLEGEAGLGAVLWNGSVLGAGGGVECRTEDRRCAEGTWYHIALRIQSGVATTLFVDGRAGRRAETTRAFAHAGTPLVLGQNGWGGIQNDPSPGWYAGDLDELRLFDRALSDDEVLADMYGR